MHVCNALAREIKSAVKQYRNISRLESKFLERTELNALRKTAQRVRGENISN